jgi:transcriptional regulator with XRE-family HTH domain
VTTRTYKSALVRERLILEATEGLVAIMEDDGITRSQLADRLEISKPEITNRLNGRNMTLGTLAEMADALGCTVSIKIERR